MGRCSRDIKCMGHVRKIQDDCTVAVQEEYKFYLSFENGLCNQVFTGHFVNF